MAENARTPVKVTVKAVEAPKVKEVEPETVQFAAELVAAVRKAHKPVFTKKLQALKDEYFNVVLSNEAAFVKERTDLEARHNALRLKNEKEFNEKVQVLKDTYGIR